MKLNASIFAVLLMALLIGCGKKDKAPANSTPKPLAPASPQSQTLQDAMNAMAQSLDVIMQKRDIEGLLTTLIDDTQELIQKFPNQPDVYNLILNGARVQLANSNNSLRLLASIEKPLSQAAQGTNGAPFLERLEMLYQFKLEWAAHHIEQDLDNARKVIRETVETVPNTEGFLNSLYTVANQNLLRGQRALLLADLFEEQIRRPPSASFTAEDQKEYRNNLQLLRLNWANQNLAHNKTPGLITTVLKDTEPLSKEAATFFEPVVQSLNDKTLNEDEAFTLEDWFRSASAMTYFYGRLQVRNKALALQRRLDAINKPLELKITTLDGRTFDLTQQRGKVVLIDFWDSRNHFSRNALKRLGTAYHKLRDKGLEIIGIAHDQNPELLNQAVTDLKIEWPVAFGDGGKHPFSRRFAVTALPTQWLVDRQGRLRNLDAWIKPTNEDRQRYDVDRNGQLNEQEALALESELRQRFIELIETLLAETEPKNNP